MAFDAIYQDLQRWKERRYEASIAAINLQDRHVLHKVCPDVARRIRLHRVDRKMALKITRLCSHFSTPEILPGGILRQPSPSEAAAGVIGLLVCGLICRRVYKSWRSRRVTQDSPSDVWCDANILRVIKRLKDERQIIDKGNKSNNSNNNSNNSNNNKKNKNKEVFMHDNDKVSLVCLFSTYETTDVVPISLQLLKRQKPQELVQSGVQLSPNIGFQKEALKDFAKGKGTGESKIGKIDLGDLTAESQGSGYPRSEPRTPLNRKEKRIATKRSRRGRRRSF